jgi:hypothetical protein
MTTNERQGEIDRRESEPYRAPIPHRDPGPDERPEPEIDPWFDFLPPMRGYPWRG